MVNVRTICLDKHPGIFVQHLPKGHPKQNMMVLMKKKGDVPFAKFDASNLGGFIRLK